MNKALLTALVPDFLRSYDSEAKDKVWQQHSAKFRRFWTEQILTPQEGTILDDACDEIIRILDRHGKGNTKGSEAVAGGMMMPQNVWRRLFNSLRNDSKLSQLLNAVLAEPETARQASLIDEQIDVLWLKGRSIVRAFEVEHTTSVYSGILRMADLLAMQPNLKIKLHIVAPSSRREKVFQEIRRPVFALLEGGALAETCTYLSYERVADLRGQQHLGHLSDRVLEDYEEEANEAD